MLHNYGVYLHLYADYTFWWLKGMFMLLTPSNWVNVSAGNFTPVVIIIAPVVKMYQDFVAPGVSDGSHTYESGILTIFRLKLHSNMKQ